MSNNGNDRLEGKFSLLEYRQDRTDSTLKEQEKRLQSMEKAVWKAFGAFSALNLLVAIAAVLVVYFHH